MVCIKPFRQGLMEYGCGQCKPCRIDRRRLWAARLMLEARKHGACLFVTLTYKPEALPIGGTLVPEDMQKWLKRLRQHCKVRYYLVGEYGEENGRPHYHVVLFGDDADKLAGACAKSWTLGLIDVRVLSWDLAYYIVGYISKNFTRSDDPKAKEFLNGRYPEFARMSLRPGIGALAVPDLRDSLVSRHGEIYMADGDVPTTVSMYGKKLPIGRYLSGRLRASFGMDERCPDAKVVRVAARERARAVHLGGTVAFEVWKGLRREKSLAKAKHRVVFNSLKRGKV